MADFRFGNPGPSPVGQALQQALLASATGGQLPGVLGLLQTLANIWTQAPPMPGAGRLQWGAWGVKSVLSSWGAVLAYQRDQDPTSTTKRPDPLGEYFSAKALVHVPGLKGLSHLIYEYSRPLGFSKHQVGTSETVVQTCRLPCGIESHFAFYSDPKGSGVSDDGWFQGAGPYVHKDAQEPYLAALADHIWSAEGGNDLQLTSRVDTHGYVTHKLTSFGQPEEYVSTGAGSAWTDVGSLAARCNAFRAAGLPRRILFYGPPGTGKTTLGRNLSRQVGGGRTMRVELKYIGGGHTGTLAQFLHLLRPAVLLFDDIDRNTNEAIELLHYLEDLGSNAWARNLVVVGTVNAIDLLDPALLRPGRFDEVRHVPEPPDAHRLAIVTYYCERFALPLDPVALSERMTGWTPADIREVVACLALAGTEHLEVEVARVGMQRALHNGEAVSKFLHRAATVATPTGVDRR